jgi:hypothetical protein
MFTTDIYMYVCMYACMYACIYACMHVRMYSELSFSMLAPDQQHVFTTCRTLHTDTINHRLKTGSPRSKGWGK